MNSSANKNDKLLEVLPLNGFPTREHLVAKLVDLRESVLTNQTVTLESVLEELEDARQLAFSRRDATAMVKATLAKATLLGLTDSAMSGASSVVKYLGPSQGNDDDLDTLTSLSQSERDELRSHALALIASKSDAIDV